MDHDHLPALSALLLAAPLTVLTLGALQLAAARGWRTAALALERAAVAPPRTLVAALLLMMAGAVHLGLVPGHLDETLLAASFVAAGVGFVGLAAAAVLGFPRWRLLTAAVLVAVLAAYGTTRITGVEPVDGLGIATVALEVGALALAVKPSTDARQPAPG